MYRIEKIGEKNFYIKVLGTLPPSVARRLVNELGEELKNLTDYSVIVDGCDFIFLKLDSFEIILEFLKKNNEALYRSAYIVSKNPPLDIEIQYILDKADSPKRKIVNNLEDAKKWIGISDIVIQRD
ncbi:hypothetical protein LCGC14_1177730 [marine sediment metagenome]|uniref:STAS domain-containing protein n=1 Tax=marine sediment metagenome TaxID=412755 RepID=A0A0F9LN19_9ZZZZ